MTEYKSYRFIDGKARWIIVDENGNIINIDPSKDELKGLEKEVYKQNKREKYTGSELLNYLKDFYQKYGRVPTQKDFDNNSKYPSATTYIRHFRSWSNSLKLVGMDLDTRVKQGNLETESEKGRWAELIVIEHFKNNPVDLSGKNYKSPCDGICPNGMNYDVKSSKLDIYRRRWKYYISNMYKEDIEIFYFLAFNEDYTKLLHVWRVPGDIVESNYFTVMMDNATIGNDVESIKKFEITEKFNSIILKK